MRAVGPTCDAAAVTSSTEQAAGPRTPALVASALDVRAGEKLLLYDAEIDVAAGRLCAVIGPSGAGKSTMLRTLAGVQAPAHGHVTFDGDPVIDRVEEIGYVPFGDLVHPQLTVREALDYAAALRLRDTSGTDRFARVDQVLERLHMTAQADQRVGSLSDGQKRRVACGSELVGRPSALVLDEPTTGLDPGLERRMMELLRELADDGLAVVLSTHATGSLELCDEIVVIGPGGRIRCTGTLDEVLRHFGTRSIDEVYAILEESPREPVPERPHEVEVDAPYVPPRRSARRLPTATQITILTSRYRLCLARERRSLAILIGQAPIIGIAIGATLPTTILRNESLGPFYGILVGFMLVIGALWLGLIGSCREVVREQDVLRREVAVGVRLTPYLTSKVLVLFPLAALQSLLLVLPVALMQPPAGAGTQYLGILGICIAAGWAGVAMGLWLSSAVRTPGQATTAVPLVLIPQLLLSGALIPIGAMSTVAKIASGAAVSRWGLAGNGSALDLSDRIGTEVRQVTGLDPAFFELGVPSALLGIAALAAAALAAALLTLERRTVLQ